MTLPHKYFNAKIKINSAVKNAEFFNDNCINNWEFKNFLKAIDQIKNLTEVKKHLQKYKSGLNSLLRHQELDDDLKQYINSLAAKKVMQKYRQIVTIR